MNPLQQLFQNKVTNIFLDSGDPKETRQADLMLDHLDGQTTNPSLIAKSPDVQEFLKTAKFKRDDLFDKYRQIAFEIHDILPDGKISAEVYSDLNTEEYELYNQAQEIAEWFPGIFVKLPITKAGLATASRLVGEGISVNMTLCFSQDQAAAVHAATKNAQGGAKVYVSPFIGRLDDIGQNGGDLIRNIQKMYIDWGSHVGVLGASIRSVEHIKTCTTEQISAMTIPFKLIKEINDGTVAIATPAVLSPIVFKDLKDLPWDQYNIAHELTAKGLEKFAADWNALCE